MEITVHLQKPFAKSIGEREGERIDGGEHLAVVLKMREKLAHIISENDQVDIGFHQKKKSSRNRELWTYHKWFCWHMLAVKSPNYWFSLLSLSLCRPFIL